MPQMGVSVAEGTVVEWRKQPGDWVERDEVIAAISTDKIDTDVESPATGRVEEILVAVGETVEVGTVLARIATDAEPGRPHVAEAGGAHVTEADVALAAPGDAGELQGDTAEDHDASAQAGAARRPGGRRYSPVVARMAAEHDLDLERIEGTGRGGRVRKQDVLAYLERGGRRAEPPMHIESPYRPDAPPAPRKRAPAAAPAEEPAAEAGAPRRRLRAAVAHARARSAAPWSSRSARPRPARRSSRRT